MQMRSKVRGEGWSDKVVELINSVGGDQNNRERGGYEKDDRIG